MSLKLVLAFTAIAGMQAKSAGINFCKLISTSDVAKHVGETVSFAGIVYSDMERAVVVPDGCSRGIGLGREITPAADKALDAVKPPKGTSDFLSAIHANLTGKITREKPSNSEFHNDDGIRISLTRVDHPVWSKWHL